MNKFVPEIFIIALLVVLAALLWNPYWMPMGAVLATLVIFIVVCGLFIGFIWREKGGDERDVLIRHVASRLGYLSGAAIMAIGIVYETLAHHQVDKWLMVAFIVTVLAKAAGYWYGKAKY